MKKHKVTFVSFLILVAALSAGFLVTASDRPPAAAAPQTHEHGGHGEREVGMCAEHNVKEDECGICQPDLLASLAPGQGLKIRFASSESADLAGVRTAAPSVESIRDGVECYAEITFDENRTAYVVSPVEGVLDDVRFDRGDRVRPGDALAALSSDAVAEAQGEYLRANAEWRLAVQAFERESALFSRRISAEKDVQEAAAAREAAAAAVRQARERLRVLGFDENEIDGLDAATGGTTGALAVRTPFAGEIIERDAVRGSRVEQGKVLFVIADRSVMWGILSVPERELSRVRVGQRVEFTADAPGSEMLEGKITWISPQVDARTRMAQARAEIRDGSGNIRSGTFARAWIDTGSPGRAVVVPETAIQRVDDRTFVFVKLAADLYESRAVALGANRNGRVEITEGIGPGDEIAVAHSYVVKSELLKSHLGAGCVDD